MSTPSLARDLGAIPEAERPAHLARIERLFGSALLQRDVVGDGHAFSFPVEEIEEIGRFVALERKCCPFLDFSIDVAAGDRPVWLVITGPRGSQRVIAAELLGPKS